MQKPAVEQLVPDLAAGKLDVIALSGRPSVQFSVVRGVRPMYHCVGRFDATKNQTPKPSVSFVSSW